MITIKSKQTPQRRSLAARKTRVSSVLLLTAVLALPAFAASPLDKVMKIIKPKADQEIPVVPGNPEDPGVPINAVQNESAPTTGSQAQPTGAAATALSQMQGTTESATLDAPIQPNGKALEVNPVNLGRESEEDESMLATDLFQKAEIRRLRGDKPRFVYNPNQRPDPMLVPWVRRAAIFKELSALADEYTAQGNFEKAVEVYQRILQLKDPRFTAIVQAKLMEISTKETKAAVALAQTQQAMEEKVELPAWIQDNTTGVIIEPEKSICLVGDAMLHVGEAVPDYPEVIVNAINPKSVSYRIKNKTFEVKLNAE